MESNSIYSMPSNMSYSMEREGKMRTSLLKLVVVTFAVSVAGSATADLVWTGAGADDLWSNPDNWTGTGTGNVILSAGNDAGNDLVIIDSATHVSYNAEIYGPEWGLTLDIDGGSLTQIHTTDPWNGFVFAPVADSAAPSIINVRNGGSLTAQELLLGDNWWFSGHPAVNLNVYDTATVTANGWCWLGGQMNLVGGTVDIHGSINFSTANGYAGINVENGTLVIRSDEFTVAMAQAWEDGGFLTAFGGTGDVIIDGSTGDVVITAVPEPATMILLGIGSLLALKRRK